MFRFLKYKKKTHLLASCELFSVINFLLSFSLFARFNRCINSIYREHASVEVYPKLILYLPQIFCESNHILLFRSVLWHCCIVGNRMWFHWLEFFNKLFYSFFFWFWQWRDLVAPPQFSFGAIPFIKWTLQTLWILLLHSRYIDIKVFWHTGITFNAVSCPSI